MNKLTLHQLQLLEQKITGFQRAGSVRERDRVRWVAREVGLSEAIVCQARYLINCQPGGWQECLQGKRSISQSYRSCKLSCNELTVSFDS